MFSWAFHTGPLQHERAIVDSEPHIVWIDNFSKLYLARMIEMEKHHLQKLLWSGIAVKRFVFPDEVSDAVMHDDTGFVIPAVAADPFKYLLRLSLLLSSMTQDHEGEPLKLLDGSLMRKWSAQSVPLLPDVTKMHSSLRDAVLAGNDRMGNFFPLGLSKENVGSNVGLSKIMRKFYIDRKMNEPACARYSTFSMDVNIYDRVLKVHNHCSR